MDKGYYGSSGIYDMTIIKDGETFDFNYSNKINIIQNCSGDYIIMDLEVIIDKIEDILKSGNCYIIAKSRSKNDKGISFIKEYRFDGIELIRKTTLNIDEDCGMNRFIYVLSNGLSNKEYINSLVESYLLNDRIRDFVLATNNMANLIGESLKGINNKIQLMNENLIVINNKIGKIKKKRLNFLKSTK